MKRYHFFRSQAARDRVDAAHWQFSLSDPSCEAVHNGVLYLLYHNPDFSGGVSFNQLHHYVTATLSIPHCHEILHAALACLGNLGLINNGDGDFCFIISARGRAWFESNFETDLP